MKPIDFEWLGEVLNELALDAGYNKNRLAEATGLSRETISRALFKGSISLNTIIILSEILNVSLDWLLLDRHEGNNPSSKDASIDHILWSELNDCDLKTKIEILDLVRVVKRHHTENLII